MGIEWRMIELLAETSKSHPFQGSVLQLGRQTVFSKRDFVNKALTKHSFKPIGEDEEQNDVSLFKRLGFSVVESMDASDYEGATLIHDLNHPVDAALEEKFDVIFDGGTTEHVFDVRQSFENIVRMLKVGGVIIHAAPVNNYIDHGFYQFSPMLFHDVYLANRFSILESYVGEHYPESERPWRLWEYHHNHGTSLRFADTTILIYFVARKEKSVFRLSTPQQSSYQRAWDSIKSKIKTERKANALKEKLKRYRIFMAGRFIAQKGIRDALRFTRKIISRKNKNKIPFRIHKRF